MNEPMTDRVRWTSADIDLLPDNGIRYEIIDGELFMAKAPHWRHQDTCFNLCEQLNQWSRTTGLGRAIMTPGVLFGEADNVIPDVIWISKERLAVLEDAAGHFTGASELAVEVLSPGAENERRDREAKLKLYATRGVQEYWIIDWRVRQVEVYRREKATLHLIATLFENDELTTPLLPGFSCQVARLFG
jgi:Uma2 family endonuclease